MSAPFNYRTPTSKATHSTVTATTINVVVTKPTGTATGNLLVAAVAGRNILGVTTSAPTGWSKLVKTTSARAGLFYKIATTAEPTSYTWHFSRGTGPWYVAAVINCLYMTYSLKATNVLTSTVKYATTANSVSVTVTSTDTIFLLASADNATATPATKILPSGFVTQGSLKNGTQTLGVGVARSATSTPQTLTIHTAGTLTRNIIAVGLYAIGPPAAPTLLTPANGSYIKTTSGVTFDFKYNSPTSLKANAYALKVKYSTAASYQYYNATTSALQTTLKYNTTTLTPNATQSVALTHTLIPNNHTWNWSASFRQVTLTLTGPFATPFSFTAHAPPTVVVTAPTGTVTTGRPLVDWTATPGTGASITGYRIRLFTSTKYTAAGFTPGTSTATWDSGQIAGNPGTAKVGITLVASKTYRAYVRVAETGTEYSAWAYSTFTTDYTVPAAPTVTATATTAASGYPIIRLTIQCHANLLTATSASGISTVGQWVDTTDVTVATGSPAHTTGLTGPSTAIKLTASAAATVSARTKTGVTAFAHVVAGATYLIMGKFMAGTGTVRTCHIGYTFYKSTGASISSGTASVIKETLTSFTRSYTHVTAPTGAAYVSLKAVVASSASGQVHWVGDIAVIPGSGTVWSGGGDVGNTKLYITRSPGTVTTNPTNPKTWYVRHASTLNRTTVPVTQKVTIDDYECVPNTHYTYTAYEVVTSLHKASAGGVSNTAMITPSGNGWWMVIPTTYTITCNAQPVTFKPQVTEQSTAHLVLGQHYPIVVSSAMGGQDGSVTFETFSATDYTDLQKILQSQQVAFLQNPYATTYTPTYARFGPESGGMSMGYGLKVKTGKLNPSTSGAPHHNTQVTWVAQPRPPV